MDKLLDYIEKYKIAIFGTVILHIIFFFTSLFTTLKDVTFIKPPEVSISIPLEDIEFEPEMEELLDLPKEETFSENISNLASNANDKREKSYENFSTNEFESLNNELTAEELEAKYFEEAKQNNERSDYAQNMEKHELNKNTPKENNQNSDGENAFAGKVMISFNLSGRNADYLANPGYTCNGTGKVVVKIKVDKAGVVKDATIIENESSRATSCMIKRAIKYAKKSRFNYKSDAAIQTGTITYNFVSK